MKRYLVPLVIGLGGVAILLWLGTWQVQRLAWKEGKLAEIAAQIDASPVPLEEALAQGIVEFQPVSTSGRYTGEEAHALTSVKGQGAGFRVISPFQTDTGRLILVDRGFIPEAQKDTARPATEAQIVANFRTPEETDFFTPAPDWEANFIFARDVEVLSTRFGTEPILLILRETSEQPAPVIPWPVDTTGIPNNHLQYAITWFSMAAVWFGMTALWIGRIRRSDER